MTDQDKSDLLEWLHRTCKVFHDEDTAVSIACSLLTVPALFGYEWSLYRMYLKASTDEQREWIVKQYHDDHLRTGSIGQVMQAIRDEFESRFGVVV